MTPDDIIHLENEVYALTNKLRLATQQLATTASASRDFVGTLWLNVGTLIRTADGFRTVAAAKFDLR